MYKIGITGNIGSGKSTIANIFKQLGVPIYDADFKAKELMITNKKLISDIKASFGEDIYNDDQSLNKKLLSSIIFNDNSKLKKINELVHPVVQDDTTLWFEKQTTNYAIKEAAILFESGANKYLDFVIGVYAPLNICIERVMQRDGIDENTALGRMNNQMPIDEKMKLCNAIIKNNDEELILPQVIALHEHFLKI